MTRKKTITIYMDAEQYQELKALQHHTKVPMAEYVREGIELLLAEKFGPRGQLELFKKEK